MGKAFSNFELLLSQLQHEHPIAAQVEVNAISNVLQKMDKRLAFLAGEPSSANGRQSAADARQLAIEELNMLRSRIQEKWIGATQKARARLFEPPEVADKLRLNSLWRDLSATRPDPVELAAAWSDMPRELQDACLSAPPQLTKDERGTLRVQELVDPQTREAAMRQRRPELALQHDSVARTANALEILLNHASEGIKE